MPAIDIAQALSDLIDDEAIRLVVYDDATGKPLKPGVLLIGHPTIGIGRCLDTAGISKDEATFLCHNDIVERVDQLHDKLPFFANLDSVRQGVLLNMSFNMGIEGLLGFHDMLGYAFSGDYARAAVCMLASHWALELPERAKKYALRMRTGVR